MDSHLCSVIIKEEPPDHFVEVVMEEQFGDEVLKDGIQKGYERVDVKDEFHEGVDEGKSRTDAFMVALLQIMQARRLSRNDLSLAQLIMMFEVGLPKHSDPGTMDNGCDDMGDRDQENIQPNCEF